MVRPGEPTRKLARKRTDKRRTERGDGSTGEKLPQLSSDATTHNSMFVCLRVRPMFEKERMEDPFADNGELGVRILDGQVVVVMDQQYQYCDPSDVLRAHRNREKQYSFHRAFDGRCGG